MCGINGFNFKDENLITAMNRVTSHRGPDGTGTFAAEGVSLGHNRLSIIDLSDDARQPMENRDGSLIIVFNGEIYNYLDVKRELNGYPFKSRSDTEVILAGYEKWGSSVVRKLNGIFAFAIWNKKTGELFLARDFAGVKPLYYFHDGTRFIFSSEIKAILEHDIPRAIDREALSCYFRTLYTPEPLTMFKSIRKFPPATFATLRAGELRMEEYWRPVRETSGASRSEIHEQIRSTIGNAVRRQLVSDRPIGIYLSGGIDSSVVLHHAAAARQTIDTYSVGFDLAEDEEREKFNKDFNLARETAVRYGTRHHEVLLSHTDVVSGLPQVAWHLDEPISNPTALAMLKLARFTKPTATVVLGGDGGDELFGGYERYQLSLIASMYQKTPKLLRTFLDANPRFRKLDTPPGILRYALFMFQKDAELRRILAPGAFDHAAEAFFGRKFFNEPASDFENLLMDTDRRSWLVDESLMRSDKMAMAAGVEARVPLLDKEVIELAYRIPRSRKVNFRETKIALKDAHRGLIPDFLFDQPKRGWFSPGAKWLRYPAVAAMAREILSPDYYAPTAELFNFDEIRKMLREHEEKKAYHLTALWSLISFQLWARQYTAVL
jgi:asparagine synthase (glutamine-hydrolysing)